MFVAIREAETWNYGVLHHKIALCTLSRVLSGTGNAPMRGVSSGADRASAAGRSAGLPISARHCAFLYASFCSRNRSDHAALHSRPLLAARSWILDRILDLRFSRQGRAGQDEPDQIRSQVSMWVLDRAAFTDSWAYAPVAYGVLRLYLMKTGPLQWFLRAGR